MCHISKVTRRKVLLYWLLSTIEIFWLIILFEGLPVSLRA